MNIDFEELVQDFLGDEHSNRIEIDRQMKVQFRYWAAGTGDFNDVILAGFILLPDNWALALFSQKMRSGECFVMMRFRWWVQDHTFTWANSSNDYPTFTSVPEAAAWLAIEIISADKIYHG